MTVSSLLKYLVCTWHFCANNRSEVQQALITCEAARVKSSCRPVPVRRASVSGWPPSPGIRPS